MPLTNLKRRMSEADDVRDDVFRHSVRQDAVKKENRTFSERTLSNQFQNVKRELSMDPPRPPNKPNQTYVPSTHFGQNFKRELSMDPPRHVNKPNLAFMPPPNTPSQLIKNEVKNPFSIMAPDMGSMRRGYNQIIMEENRVIWVTKWVDYSNK